MNNQDYEALMMAFKSGVDYGLLIAEEERDSEDLYDAALCSIHAQKMCIPSVRTERRMPHSEKWRQAKRDSYSSFLKHIKEVME